MENTQAGQHVTTPDGPGVVTETGIVTASGPRIEVLLDTPVTASARPLLYAPDQVTGDDQSGAVVADYKAAEEHLDQHAGPGTHRLTELTAAHGEDETEIRLDPANRVIWWARAGTGGWTVQRLTPADAARDADAVADLAEDRLAAREYEHSDQRERDEDLLDEYAEILVLTAPQEPRAARAQIARTRELAAREDARWQRADAALVRGLVGTERGGKAAAARTLGISETQVGRILAAATARRSN